MNEFFGVNEHSCLSCAYKLRYSQLLMNQAYLNNMPEDAPEREMLEDGIGNEIYNLLAFGNYIATERCEGNTRALEALLN